MISRLSEDGVVEQCNLIGADYQSGSHLHRNRTGLLLRQANDERLRRFSIDRGFVDVGMYDQKWNRKPGQKISARQRAGAEDEPVHRRFTIRYVVSAAYSR